MTGKSARSNNPYFCAYVHVHGQVLFEYFDNLKDDSYRLYGNKNTSTGEITFDINPQLAATIMIANNGEITLIYRINNIDKIITLQDIELAINSPVNFSNIVKQNWLAFTTQQADYLYCVSDCWAPYKYANTIGDNIYNYCFDLESGSYIRDIRITGADIVDSINGKNAISFLTSTNNYSKSKLQPRSQVYQLASTPSYDAFNLVATVDGSI